METGEARRADEGLRDPGAHENGPKSGSGVRVIDRVATDNASQRDRRYCSLCGGYHPLDSSAFPHALSGTAP